MARGRVRTAWSKLTEKGRARLRADGVNPQSYNAWSKRKASKKAGVSRADFIRGKTPEQQRRKARQASVRTTPQRPSAPTSDRRHDAEDRLFLLHGGSPWAKRRSIRRGVDLMDAGELDIALTAPRPTIQNLARRPPDGRIAPGESEARNPFWYK